MKQAELAERVRVMVDRHRLPAPNSLVQPTISELERGTQRIPLSWLHHIDEDVFGQPKGTLLRLADLVDPLVDLAAVLAADPDLDDVDAGNIITVYNTWRSRSAPAAIDAETPASRLANWSKRTRS